MEINRNLWTKCFTRDPSSPNLAILRAILWVMTPYLGYQSRTNHQIKRPFRRQTFSQVFPTFFHRRSRAPHNSPIKRANLRRSETDSAQNRRDSHADPMHSQRDFPYLSHKIPNRFATLRNVAYLTAWLARAWLLGCPYPSTGLLETTWGCLTQPPRPA